MRRRWITIPLGFVLLAGVVGACGNGEESGSVEVEISAFDDLRFDPSSVTVQAREPVTFRVTNDGETAHEWVLGPESVQMAHEEMGAEGMMDHGEMGVEGQLAALELEPGESEDVTVTFDEPGAMPFGCHEPGHFEGGMKGTVTVE